MDDLLNSIYYDTKNIASFSNANNLYSAANKINPQLTLKIVKFWLSKQPSYVDHKQTINNFTRNRVLVNSIDEEFQADLMDIKNVSKQNNGFSYLLNVIDVLSKFAFSIPLKSKSAHNVATALERIFEVRLPSKLHTDRGLEFLNKPVSQVLQKFNVMHTTTNDKQIKASIVERFNRTLRMRIARYTTFVKKKKFIDKLHDIINSYNNTIHRSIKMKPSEVTLDTQHHAFNNLYGGKSYLELLTKARKKTSRITVGDFVRVKEEKTSFARGYTRNWSLQVYRIREVIASGQMHTYKIQDSQRKVLKRRFYANDLQVIAPPSNYIRKVINKRTRNGSIEYFVEWEDRNVQSSWIKESDIFNVEHEFTQ